MTESEINVSLSTPAAADGEPVAEVIRDGATVRLQWASVKAAHNAKPCHLFAAAPSAVAPPQFETCPCGTWGRWKPMPLASMQTEAVASPSECDSLTDRGATPAPQTRAVLDVLAERRRQIEAEGWTPGHDNKHTDGSMATAAGCYAIHAAIASGINSGEIDRYAEPWRRFDKAVPDFWPWDREWWNPTVEPRRNLVKAGALILAEIERLDRAPGATPGGQEGEGAA